MNSAVNVQGRFRLESFAARVADERTFARMNGSPMIFHRCLHRERSSAYVARVILHPSVNVFQMIVETTGLSKLFAAYVARKLLLTGMNSRVGLQTVAQTKFLPAQIARERTVRASIYL